MGTLRHVKYNGEAKISTIVTSKLEKPNSKAKLKSYRGHCEDGPLVLFPGARLVILEKPQSPGILDMKHV